MGSSFSLPRVRLTVSYEMYISQATLHAGSVSRLELAHFTKFENPAFYCEVNEGTMKCFVPYKPVAPVVQLATSKTSASWVVT